MLFNEVKWKWEKIWWKLQRIHRLLLKHLKKLSAIQMYRSNACKNDDYQKRRWIILWLGNCLRNYRPLIWWY